VGVALPGEVGGGGVGGRGAAGGGGGGRGGRGGREGGRLVPKAQTIGGAGGKGVDEVTAGEEGEGGLAEPALLDVGVLVLRKKMKSDYPFFLAQLPRKV